MQFHARHIKVPTHTAAVLKLPTEIYPFEAVPVLQIVVSLTSCLVPTYYMAVSHVVLFKAGSGDHGWAPQGDSDMDSLSGAQLFL